MVKLTITLADGTSYSFEQPRTPKNWQSWLLREMPYGMHSLAGAKFERERVA